MEELEHLLVHAIIYKIVRELDLWICGMYHLSTSKLIVSQLHKQPIEKLRLLIHCCT